jgi:hypothetical protein
MTRAAKPPRLEGSADREPAFFQVTDEQRRIIRDRALEIVM